jgi:nucleotide-binding universal stress UspA family protein
MAPHAIISYDDTQNDHDALMLGRILRDAGAKLTLAYVRHTTQSTSDRERLAGHDAEALLERGAQWLDDPYVERRVVLSASTGEGLGWLAQQEQEQADIIVFGSDYRTPAGHVSLGRSAQTLLERGPAAMAIAPAEYHSDRGRQIEKIGVLPGTADEAAIETAFSLAERFEATVIDGDRGVDLLVVGSRSEAPEGRVMISSHSQNAVEEATSPVLIVARGVALHFETLVTA